VTDTVTLCGNTEPSSFHFFLGGKKGDDQPKVPKNVALADEHWTWIENQLKEANEYPYVVVVGHFPIYSISAHGPTNCLVEKLQPLLEKYKVTAFISGHDHNLQHLQTKSLSGNFTMNYVVSGTGAYMDGSTKHIDDVPPNSSRFFYPTRFWESATGELGLGAGGIVVVEAKKDAMTFIYYKGNGDEIYKFSVGPR